MLIYRITKADDKILPILWKENRNLNCISDGKMYWSKKEIKKRNTKEVEATPEFLEFIKKYREIITNKGSYDNRLISKYEEALKDKTHEEHIKK